MYERKLQAGVASSTNNTFELSQQWNPSRKIPKHDIAGYTRQCKVPIKKRKDDYNRAGSPTAWNLDEVKPSKKALRGAFLQHDNAAQGLTAAQLMTKHVKSTIDSRAKSPKWSEECLHKRELTRCKNQRAVERIAMTEKGCVMSGIKLGKISVGRTQSGNGGGTCGQGRGSARRMLSPKLESAKARIVYKSPVVIKSPNFTKESEKVNRSPPGHKNGRRVMMLEENESRWAPSPNWTIGKVTLKGVKGRSVSSKKILKDGEPLPTKTQDQKENLNLKTISANKSPKLSPPRMQSNETSSSLKGKRRQCHSPHHEKTNLDCKFEVISIETKEFEERNPDCYIPVSCGTQNSCPNPKQIFLRIPKCRQKNDNDKGQKAAINVPNTETKEKWAMSKEKCDRDMKLRVEIRSELPLDVIDGRLKQFLKGVGGLIYYSPKDGGIPRIKELTNYFSGKQPLLWFSPRST